MAQQNGTTTASAFVVVVVVIIISISIAASSTKQAIMPQPTLGVVAAAAKTKQPLRRGRPASRGAATDSLLFLFDHNNNTTNNNTHETDEIKERNVRKRRSTTKAIRTSTRSEMEEPPDRSSCSETDGSGDSGGSSKYQSLSWLDSKKHHGKWGTTKGSTYPDDSSKNHTAAVSTAPAFVSPDTKPSRQATAAEQEANDNYNDHHEEKSHYHSALDQCNVRPHSCRRRRRHSQFERCSDFVGNQMTAVVVAAAWPATSVDKREPTCPNRKDGHKNNHDKDDKDDDDDDDENNHCYRKSTTQLDDDDDDHDSSWTRRKTTRNIHTSNTNMKTKNTVVSKRQEHHHHHEGCDDDDEEDDDNDDDSTSSSWHASSKSTFSSSSVAAAASPRKANNSKSSRVRRRPAKLNATKKRNYARVVIQDLSASDQEDSVEVHEELQGNTINDDDEQEAKVVKTEMGKKQVQEKGSTYEEAEGTEKYGDSRGEQSNHHGTSASSTETNDGDEDGEDNHQLISHQSGNGTKSQAHKKTEERMTERESKKVPSSSSNVTVGSENAETPSVQKKQRKRRRITLWRNQQPPKKKRRRIVCRDDDLDEFSSYWQNGQGDCFEDDRIEAYGHDEDDDSDYRQLDSSDEDVSKKQPSQTTHSSEPSQETQQEKKKHKHRTIPGSHQRRPSVHQKKKRRRIVLNDEDLDAVDSSNGGIHEDTDDDSDYYHIDSNDEDSTKRARKEIRHFGTRTASSEPPPALSTPRRSTSPIAKKQKKNVIESSRATRDVKFAGNPNQSAGMLSLTSSSYHESFYDDLTGTKPMRAKTIMYAVSVMKTEAKRMTEGAPPARRARQRRLLQTMTTRIRKRLRAIKYLPLVYIQSNDGNAFSNADLAQYNEKCEKETRNLQLYAGKLQRQRLRLQQELEEALQKGDTLRQTIDREQSAAEMHIHPRLLNPVPPVRLPRAVAAIPISHPAVVRIAPHAVTDSTNCNSRLDATSPSDQSAATLSSLTTSSISSSTVTAGASQSLPAAVQNARTFYRPAPKDTVKNLFKQWAAQSRSIFGRHP